MNIIKLSFATLLLCFTFAFASGQEKDQTSSPVDRTSELTHLSDDFELADGPCWNGSSLMIPDVKDEKLFRFIARKNEFQNHVSQSGRISATFFNHGRTYLCDNPGSRIAFLDGKKIVTVASFEKMSKGSKKPYRPNDLVVDKHGGMYVTFTPQNQVLYVSADGTQTLAVKDIKTPNGITISPDESTLYVSSFLPKKVWAYDISSPGITKAGRELGSMDTGPERGADGMTIDRAGNIYCTGPSDVWIWSPGGTLLDKIAMPTKPINCTFGDSDMRMLYITGPGGVYTQRMKISGRSPEPVSLALLPEAKVKPKINSKNQVRPSTIIPETVTPHIDVVFAQYGERKLLADIFVPDTASAEKPVPCLVVVFGGGWHKGDKTKFRALAIEMAKRGYVSAAIEYRLADEAAFPAAMHDCSAAVRFLRANANQYHIDSKRIGAIGGSAGGHLSGLMASGANNPKLQGEGGNRGVSSQIQASIVMAGPMEMLTGSVADRSRQNAANSNSNSWLRGTVDQKPELYRTADAFVQIDKGTCPILFMVGSQDKPDRNQPSVEKLQSLGIFSGIKVYPDAKHGCWNQNPWFAEMTADMDSFFREHLK